MLKRILLLLLSLLLILGCCSCNNNNSNESESSSETEESTPADKVVLSGDTRYRIVYAKDTNKAPAQKIYNRLKALDKNAIADDYYTLTTDEAPDDGTPEIVVGLTNRTASATAKEALPSYLDYSITVDGNKIIIYANTEDRLADATKYFAGELVKTKSGMVYYPTSTLFVDSYKNYKIPTLKIGDASIDKFSIILPSAASDTEKAAADTVQLWIAENTGNVLPIKADTEAASANEIIIGKANREECSSYTDSFSEKVYFSTSVAASKLLIYAGKSGSYSAAISAFKEKVIELQGNVASMDTFKSPDLIKNKKAIFVGNSFIYWGTCVTFIPYKDEKDAEIDAADMALRLQGGDKGYFSQICKANGTDIDVYNFTYGGQNLDWIYEKKLKDLDKTFLEDIDYVFISEAGQDSSSFRASFDKVASLFTKAEEIVYLAHENTFRADAKNIINELPKLSASGVKVVAWGDLVSDIYNGEVTVPNAKITYNRNSFVKNSTGLMPLHSAVISLSGNGDNFHQNPLAGYITAQMAFSAITGSSCVGQKYDFCWDKTIAPQYDFDNFIECQYNNGQTTNFVEIFNSADDMNGIQQLMDVYMAKYN